MSRTLLSDNTWFLEKHLDVEYQTYRLLAYLQHVREQFLQIKLYPYLSQLIRHYEFIDSISSRMEEIRQKINNELNDEVTEYIHEISNIIKNKIKGFIEEGISIFNIVLKSIRYETIGIVPEYNQEGYIIASYEKLNYLDIMKFYISSIINYDKFYVTGIDHLESLYTESALRKAPEFIKGYILGKYRDLPNPIVIYVNVAYHVPLHETLIPIIKRILPVWIRAI